MSDWYELAKRWTPKCPACGKRMDCRGGERCINPECPQEGKVFLPGTASKINESEVE